MKFEELVALFSEAKKMKKSSKGMPKKMLKGKSKKDDKTSEEGGYDVNKDGKVEPWEAARSKAIAKSKKKNASKK
jgi:hypothetical protein